MKLTKSQLNQIIKEELEEAYLEWPRTRRTTQTATTTSGSPIRSPGYNLDDVEKLAAALPALEKAGLLSLHLSSLKRELSEWVAVNVTGIRQRELLDLIRPNPVL